jgi:hypothetical protein
LEKRRDGERWKGKLTNMSWLDKMMNDTLHIDVFGKRMIAEHRSGRWQLSIAGADGKRSPISDVVVPADITSEKDLLTFLHDVYHESARPGHDQVTRT